VWRTLAPALLCIAAMVAAASCGGSPAAPEPNTGGSASPAPTPSFSGPPSRVLVVTHTTGFRHSSIEVAETVIQSMGRSSGLYDTTFCRTADDVNRLLSREALAGVDTVVFANTTGNLGIPDLDAFLGWIAAGHGFAGMHSASDTYHDAPAFIEMLGNEFATHGDQAMVQAVVEAPSHPSVAHLGTRYVVFDEIYRFAFNNRDRVTPVLTLDRYPADGLPNAGEPGDLPLAWSRSYGGGRVFYTALGHRDELWRDTVYQQHVFGGIRWALGR
jgi:type 1 glutamine amidotransferase